MDTLVHCTTQATQPQQLNRKIGTRVSQLLGKTEGRRQKAEDRRMDTLVHCTTQATQPQQLNRKIGTRVSQLLSTGLRHHST
jgi:hypothetical protein